MIVKKTHFMIITLITILVFIMSPVNAETLNGTLGSVFTQSVDSPISGGGGAGTYANLRFPNIEQTGGLFAVIRWTTTQPDSFLTGADVGSSVPVSASTGTHIFGNGTIGYQRVLNSATPPVDIVGGYIWIVFDSWNITGQTGTKNVVLSCNMTALGLSGANQWGAEVGPTGKAGIFWGGTTGLLGGNYLFNYYVSEQANYIATKPSGLGISGSISKVGNSRAFVADSRYITLTSDTTYNEDPVNFTTNASSIYISILGTSGNWYNSSLLFTPVVPTVTLTPITTIPPGYVRTYAYTSDCISGARISESDIAFKNLDLSTWSNSTQDPDGKYFIDTLPYTNLDIYGAYTKTALQYGSDSYISQNVGLYGGQSFALQLCPTQQNPGTGNTNVLVTVYDTTNYLPLPYTTVSLKLSSTGATTIDSTGSSGTASFVTTNNSVIILTASKAGYITGAKTLTTSTGLITTAKLYLDRQIVTTAPTLTSAPGGTIPTTIDPAGSQDSGGNYPAGYSNIKGQQMLDWLAANGMMLVQLCFMVTVLALFGKFGK